MAWMPEHIIMSLIFAYFVRGYTQDMKHIVLFAFAGSIPDFDAIISLVLTGDLYALHGNWFHSPFSWTIMSFVWTALLIYVLKIRMRFLSVYMIMYAGGIFHFIIDSCYYTHSSVMWFLPFTTKTFSWYDLLNIKIATDIAGEFTPFFMTFLMVIACVMLLMKFACDIDYKKYGGRYR